MPISIGMTFFAKAMYVTRLEDRESGIPAASNVSNAPINASVKNSDKSRRIKEATPTTHWSTSLMTSSIAAYKNYSNIISLKPYD